MNEIPATILAREPRHVEGEIWSAWVEVTLPGEIVVMGPVTTRRGRLHAWEAHRIAAERWLDDAGRRGTWARICAVQDFRRRVEEAVSLVVPCKFSKTE